MDARAAAGHTDSKRLTRSLPQRRMEERVLNLIEISRQSPMQLRQRPYGESFWVHRLRDLPDITRDLCIASQVVNELRVRGSKQSFTRRSESWLSRGSCLFRALIPGQQRFKIRALKLPSSVDNQNLRKPAESPDAFPQGHHAGPVTRWIERQIERERPARKSIR